MAKMERVLFSKPAQRLGAAQLMPAGQADGCLSRARFEAPWLTRAQATFALCVAFIPLIVGCNSARKQDRLLLFPSPPTPPRVQFLTWASGAADIEGPRSGIVELAFGDRPIKRARIHKPYGIAARDGVVYACDTKIPGLCRLDFKNRTFSVLGTSDPCRLRKPINVVIDRLGYKFVADAERRQVVVFGPDDSFVRTLDIPAPSRPVDVAIWENELFVLDNDESCQVVVLDRQTGEVLRTFGSRGVEPGQFRIPNSLCIGPEGNLYVSDTLNWRIQKLTRDGDVIWTRGTAGRLLGQFGRPRSLRVGPDGIIYVVDAVTEIVQMISSDGDMLMHFGGSGTVPGSMVLPAGITIDTASIPYFRQYVHKDMNVEYLLFVSNQFGEHLISIYAFGSFPEGYQFEQGQIASLPPVGAGQDAEPVIQAPPTQPAQDRSDGRSERGTKQQ